jgi:hypothetical protein
VFRSATNYEAQACFQTQPANVSTSHRHDSLRRARLLL